MDTTKLIEEAGQLTTEEFASGATNGPWRVDDLVVIMAGEEAVAECFSVKDARFIARARTLIPELAAALKASEESLQDARAELAPRIACIGRMEEERRALQSANLAANKRIVELEHERDEWMRRAQGWESETAIATERFNRLSAAQPGEPLDLDCGDSSCAFARTRGGMRTNGGCRCLENLGFCRGQTDSLRRMAAEIVSLRKRLLDLTTPRPIAEAPRKAGSQIIALWMHGDVVESLDVVCWADMDDGEHPERKFWMNMAGDSVEHMTHYLPLPEVKP